MTGLVETGFGPIKRYQYLLAYARLNTPKNRRKAGKMSLWTAIEIEQALQLKQKLPDNIEIDLISIDSRNVKPNSMFFGLKGENHNGSDYAVSALKNGAELCIVDHYPIHDPKLKAKMILVPDVYQAMISLAKYARQRFSGKLIAVTGSAGKTSTKEMLGLALSDYKTFINPGNKNNLIGLPFSLCQVQADCQFVVLEVGMNRPGELRQLSHLAQPHIAVVTNVYPAHLQFFDSVADIARAKAEIFEGVLPSGHGVFPGDSEYSSILADVARSHNLSITTFGEKKEFNGGKDCDIRLGEVACESYDDSKTLSDGSYVRMDSKSYLVKIHTHGKVIEYKTSFNSKHMIINSLAIAGVIQALDLNMQSSLGHLQKFTPLAGRGMVHHLRDDITLIDDSYNANPGSMRAGIANLANHRNGRLIAIIGDMRELGDSAIDLHKSLLDEFIAKKVDKVFTVGDLMSELFAILPEELQGVETNDAITMAKSILNHLQPRDSILVKGSFSMDMNRIVSVIVG